MDHKNQPDELPEILETARYEAIASMKLTGVSNEKIRTEIGVKRHELNRILASDKFKGILTGITEKAVSHAISSWKTAISEATPDAIKLFHELLKDKNPRALDFYLKTIGLDKEQPNVQASSLTVILPSGPDNDKNIIEVKNETD